MRTLIGYSNALNSIKHFLRQRDSSPISLGTIPIE
jgi:hypothetical protein